jgi:hypothetical protein
MDEPEGFRTTVFPHARAGRRKSVLASSAPGGETTPTTVDLSSRLLHLNLSVNMRDGVITRCDLPRHHENREIPWNDLPDNSDGLVS